jgi:hypothetical protein
MAKVVRAKDRAKAGQLNRADPRYVQQQADSFHDLLDVLSEADSHGFPPMRSRLIRERATEGTRDAIPRIQRLENRIRYWLRRHEM